MKVSEGADLLRNGIEYSASKRVGANLELAVA
jgi:hypothetical protein